METPDALPLSDAAQRLLIAQDAVAIAGDSMRPDESGIVPKVQSDHFHSCLAAVGDLRAEVDIETQEAKRLARQRQDQAYAIADAEREDKRVREATRQQAYYQAQAREQRWVLLGMSGCALTLIISLVIALGYLLRIGWGLAN